MRWNLATLEGLSGKEMEENVGEGCGARLLCGHIVPHCVEEPSVGGPSFLSWGRMASPLAHGTSCRALTHWISHPLSLFDLPHHRSPSSFLRVDMLTFFFPSCHMVFPNSNHLGPLSVISPGFLLAVPPSAQPSTFHFPLSTFPPHTSSVNPLTTFSPSRVVFVFLP